MTDEIFRMAIIERPFDMSIRRVYADYLEETGDPRGAFIRAGMVNDANEQYDLISKHWSDWVRPLQDALQFGIAGRGWFGEIDERRAPCRFYWNRGFIGTINFPYICRRSLRAAVLVEPITFIGTEHMPFQRKWYDVSRMEEWYQFNDYAPSNARIGHAVFKKMRQRGFVATFRTDRAATKALSCALIDLAREDAGLPKMEWPKNDRR